MWKISVILMVLTSVLAELPSAPRNLPAVEKNPLLLNSYIPASMQVIAHLTDLMKYEVHKVDDTKTTTTIRPTPAHSPAIFAPKNPLGAEAYFAKTSPLEDFLERLKKTPGSYFDRYFYPLVQTRDEFDLNQQPLTADRTDRALDGDGDLNLFGPRLSSLLKQVNNIDDYDFDDADEKAMKFSSNYDDTYFRGYVIGNKKVPPTKAYVTMLHLYDGINKEAKTLQLSKYGGYADDVLQVLIESSTGSSSEQLTTVLSRVIQNHSLKEPKNVNKIKTLLEDLEQPGSYINEAIKNIPPLQFAP